MSENKQQVLKSLFGVLPKEGIKDSRKRLGKIRKEVSEDMDKRIMMLKKLC